MTRFRVLLALLGGAAAGLCIFVASVLARFGALDDVPQVAIHLFVSLLLTGVGLWVGAVRPEHPTSRNASLGLYFTGILWLRNCIAPHISQLHGADALLLYFYDSAYPLHFVFGLRFFVEFPPGAPPSRGLHILRAVNDVVGISLLFIAKVVELRPFLDLPALPALDLIYENRSFYTGSAILAVLVAGVRNYRAASDPDARRRVRWIVLGAVVALVPEMLAKFAKALGHELPLELFTTVAVAVLPITFGYAVVKHHVLDIQVVVRRSLHYLLARNMLTLLVAIPAVAIVVDVILDPNRTIRQVFFDSWPRFLLLAIAGLALRFHAPLRRGLDRFFFRDAVNAEIVLQRVSSRLKSADSPDAIPSAVSAELAAAFHPRSFEFVLREELSDDLRARLETAEEPVLHESSLAIPVRGSDDLLSGAMVLGEKASGQPYGPNDRRLLGAIGAHVGYALEMRRLRERVVEEQRLSRQALARLSPLLECPRCGLCAEAVEHCPADGSRMEIGLPVSLVIDGKYQLVRRIGRGGMGSVYEANDLELGRSIAIKVLSPGAIRDGATLRRFEREGRAMARLHHPGIVAIHEFGRIGSDSAYLAMELLHGRTLRDELDEHDAPVEPSRVATWFEPIFEAVSVAHAAGVVHRDLKPENVFLTRAGTVKVLDFGLARLDQPGEGVPSMTTPGILVGTLGYIAPEQFLGKPADPQSDVFALGVMVFEALTNELPYLGNTVAQLATSVFVDDPHLEGDAPEVMALDRVLGRCLASSRKRRFATVAEMREALLPALHACSITVQRASLM